MKKTIGLYLMLLIICNLSHAQRTLIHCGMLIDGIADNVQHNKTIIIENDRISAVIDGFAEESAGDTLYDFSSRTVLPGLMDMHTHLSGQFHPNVYQEKFYMDLDDYAYRSTVYARRTLMAGFTTVREVGGNVSLSLRDAIQKDYVVGPRIFSAGKSIGTTGGHADPTNSLREALMGDPGPNEGVINGVDDAVKAVRQRYKNGADLIKITATGGVLSEAKNSQNPQFTEKEIQAIVQTAKDYGMHVAAHAHGSEGMKRAIRAGVRTIEHGTLMDDETMELMKKYGTFYVPTVMAGEWVTAKSKVDGYFPDIVRPKAAEIGPVIKGTLQKAYKAGVKIAFGTDSGVSEHGKNAQEFQLMVDAGVPALAAIKSATSVAAQLLEISDRLGSIDAGKIADIIAVEGNPVDDISVLQHVVFVMKEGRIYKND